MAASQWPRPEPSARHGFTIVELLAVVAIVILLVGLLLPAVQGVRESARRVLCANGLKQVAVGILAHHFQVGHFPVSTPEAGYAKSADAAEVAFDDNVRLTQLGLSADGVSWMVRVLPYVEEAPRFDQIVENMTSGSLSQGNGLVTNNAILRRAIATTLPIYLCPSDNAAGKTRTDVWSDNGGYSGIPIAVSNCCGVIGPGWIATQFPWLGDTFYQYCNNHAETIPAGRKIPLECPGSFWRHSFYTPVTLDSFSDGTATTQIVGERVPAGDRDTQGLNPWSAWPTANTCMAYHAMGLNFVDRVNSFNADGTPMLLETRNFGFGSRHRGGAFFAYADGHVAFMDDLVAINVYWALSTRNGGSREPLGFE